MLLSIDAGNTRTKWAVFNADGVSIRNGVCANKDLVSADLSPTSLGYERIVISNVAGKQHEALLSQILAHYNLPIRWVTSTPEACGVMNNYLLPEKLGTDRWAALVAAWHIKQVPCIVVNAGTAVTIDALNSNQKINQADFIGGLILPGLNLMQKSLGLNAAQLPAHNAEFQATPDHTPIFAKNTVEAIYSGATHAVIGAITLMASALQIQSKQIPSIIISGGDAKLIYDNLTTKMENPILIIDNLVLQGLFLIEKSMQSETL